MSDRGSVKDCKVILGESVTSQHRPLVCTLGRSVTPRRKVIGVQRTKWWKLADKDMQSQFVAAARDKLQQSEREGNRSFEEVTEDLRKLGERLLGRTSGKCKPGKETWWWNDEVQESLKRKKEAKKTLDMENNDENKEVYKLAKKEAKKSVARAKARAYQVLYEDMETIDGQKRALRMAKQRDKNSKDIYQTKLIKDEKGNVLVENAEILKRWQEYFNKLMNEENPRESRQETQRVVEKRTIEITSEEVEKAMKKMKNGMMKVQESRLRNIVEISEEQFGFMKGKSTTDAIFVLRQLQEKFREGQEELHGVVIDLEKAYDRVPREELYWCMRDKGVP
nr:uncharacterized protein LOC113819172 [Penaeus vannamei]